MSRTTLRAPLILTDEERQRLESLASSRKAPLREIQRAKILLAYSGRMPIQDIARNVGVNRQTVYKCIDKALSMGYEAGLADLYHGPRDPVITPDAKAWVVSLACTPPKDLGMAAELWTRSALAAYVRSRAEAAGHPCLAKAAKATVHRILEGQTLKPHKITDYLERKDPEFDRKMREVLMVYREAENLRRPSGHHGQRGRETGRSVSGHGRSGPSSGSRKAPDRLPGLRIQAPRNSLHSGGAGPSGRSCDRKGARMPSEPGVCRPSQGDRYLLSS